MTSPARIPVQVLDGLRARYCGFAFGYFTAG
jgi:hypothetical protein